MTEAEMKKFSDDFDKEIRNAPKTNRKDVFTCDFTDMRISDVGFGKKDYKTSKPNILKNDAVVQEILRISDATEAAIGHTIGPYADSTLIQTWANAEDPVYHTRDGYEILSHMGYTQPIPNAIYKIIRSTSEHMQNVIGDSTSSGIPIQNAMLKKFIDIFNDQTKGEWKFSPVGIGHITRICVGHVIKGFTDNPTYQKIFPKPDENGKYDKETEDEIVKWLAKVATISCNNDYELGAKIAELYRNKLDGRGHVLAVKSDTEEEYVRDTNAFTIAVGLLDHEKMSNTADGLTWEENEPLIAMFDGPLHETDLPGLKKIVQTAIFDLNRPLFITASQYNHNIAHYLKECIDGTYYNELGEEIADENSDHEAKPHACSIAAIILRNKYVEEQNLFDDTLLMTGAHSFSTELSKLTEYSDDRSVRKAQLENLFGSCEKIIASFGDVQFIGCKPNKEKMDKRIAELKKRQEILKTVKMRMSRTDDNYDDVGLRIDQLQARTTIYYCGGHTERAKKSRLLLIEDATNALHAAIRNGGVSIGSNMSVSHYIHHNFEKIVDDSLETINNARINITAASNYDLLRNVIEVILQTLEFSFGNAYRYALYNMYRDASKTMRTWEIAVSNKKPAVYNIMSNRLEEFDSSDVENCTTIIVPRRTDEYLLKIITENITSLINIGNMITIYQPDFDLDTLRLRQMETGALYNLYNTVASN